MPRDAGKASDNEKRRSNDSNNRKILLLTNSELGEANVFLALSPALLQADPDVEVHLASFASLKQHVDQVNANFVEQALPSIIFHEIQGSSMLDSETEISFFNTEALKTPLRFSTSIQALNGMVPMLVPYHGPQLVRIVKSLIDIIRQLEPDVVVVNSLMTAGLTACYHLQVKFACLSPNSIKAFAGRSQPWLRTMWKHPAPFSGYSYPVPLHLIPLNVCFLVYLIYIWRTDARRREVAAHLQAETGAVLRTALDLLQNRPPGLKILVSSYPELDIPLVVPPFVHPCGPIVRCSRAVADADPKLLTWLARGPTIYVNLGSLVWFDAEQTTEMAQALRLVVDTLEKGAYPGIQLLWKLKADKACKAELETLARSLLNSQAKDGRVKIVDWIQAEPLSVLKSGHVVCSVNHGGASSFNEAIVAGVPQIILPVWTDCHDNAIVVEMLGVGRHGSKATKPKWTAPELSSQLLAVLDGEPAEEMRRKAKELSTLCASRGDGAEHAARILLEDLSQARL
ncbi:hypothetical protein L249_7712 [Ophiocordyceps polyrhachis-furcata BCC 54312]|uniref:Erythromycin biosynthesis protein CIII-like C-terminal domain-containing protein n=1 Tax=Ophiocordyceps polyrhachis-furcata BCC 54312 TaxID=1330021 RepID=A0A367LAS4_9HYPO|nr:hypothetical protein L249_7712 [Ophiocordyceps polyrhachis-furcata BCC 54312]